MPSTRSVLVAALYVLSLTGTAMLFVAAALDNEAVSVTLIITASALILTTGRLMALNRPRQHGAAT